MTVKGRDGADTRVKARSEGGNTHGTSLGSLKKREGYHYLPVLVWTTRVAYKQVPWTMECSRFVEIWIWLNYGNS
jgi:hypothetical protein